MPRQLPFSRLVVFALVAALALWLACHLPASFSP